MSAIRLTRAYLPGMVERGWGRAQFMASDSAVVLGLDQAAEQRVVAYLNSDLASATTGGAVRVDGGDVDHILP